MAQPVIQVFQVRSKRYRRTIEPNVVSFAASLVGELRQIELAPVGLPVAVTKMSHTRGINRRDQNTRALRVLDRLVNLWIEQVTAAVEEVDSIRGHEHLAAFWALRPAFNQIGQ